MVLTAVLSMIRYIGDIDDRDFVDRMHSYFTTNILIAFSILVSFKQFGGKPVECLVPDIFSGSWEQLYGERVEEKGLYVADAHFLSKGVPAKRIPLQAKNFVSLEQPTLRLSKFYAGAISSDYFDNVLFQYTTRLLVFFAILSHFTEFYGRSIDCLVPEPFFMLGIHEYAENYCWAQDTYYIPMREVVDGMPSTEKKQRRISYYQWVPFFLLLEAACFRLPSLLWKYMAGHSGIKLHEIVKLSSDPNNIKPEIKKANIKSLTTHLQGALRFHRRLRKKQIHPHRYLRMFNIPYTASFVTCMYILTKLTYLLNACVQLLILNRFLETDRYNWYGFGAIYDLINGTTWEQSGMFPRVSLCDFDVRVMGNIQEHTIQCVLVINIFNEKIFIFLWFWYLALIVFTAGSLLYWIAVCIIPYPNRNFITRHLEMSELPFDPQESREDVERFISTYLKNDGMFVIRMITLHSGVIFGTELVIALWKSYFGTEPQLRRSSSFPAGATIWSPPLEKQFGGLDMSRLDNDSNLKLLQSKLAETKENTQSALAKILDAGRSEKAPLLSGERLTAPPLSFRKISAVAAIRGSDDSRLVRRTAARSPDSPSTSNSPPRKSTDFVI